MGEQDDIYPDYEGLREEACAWVLRLQAADATTADQAELLRWRAQSPAHARALGEAVRLRRLIVEAGKALREPPKQSAHSVSAIVPGRGRVGFGRRAFLGGAIAASAAGILAVRPPMDLWPSFAELRASYRTGTGERRTIALAKGVSVELNTRTAVSLHSDARQDGLKLIAGEIAVDAPAALRPVAITTGDGTATARAGRFGVQRVGHGTCVTCLAGQVDVACDKGTATLAAGQQLTFTADQLGSVSPVDIARAESWRRGLLIFVDAPLRHVVDELNRYRPGLIVLANSRLDAFPVNAVYQLDRLTGVVDQISQVADARVTRLPGGVVVLT